MDKIIIYIQKDAIMTGILFYCVEHYLYLSKNTNVQLCIIFEGNVDLLSHVKGIIKEKYVILNTELDNIVQIKLLDLLKVHTHKAMVLDTDTYRLMGPFMRKILKIFLYSNDKNHDARHQDNVYGFYNYQKFHIKERFKIGFDFMKPKTPILDKTFCSHLLIGVKRVDKKLIEEVAKYEVTYKDFYRDLDIFEYKEIVYYHTKDLDRNNRIIPEAFWFGNEITLINTLNTDDSVLERYHTCMNDGVKQFNMNDEYRVTKDFLEF